MDFQDFIHSRRDTFAQACLDGACLEIVLGNESCDLDSAVSAIAYAFLLQREKELSVVPVLNVPRADYTLKTEVVFLLNKYAITQSDLVFIDDLRTLRQGEGHTFNLHLVDHNVLTDSQADMANRIVSIVDHHHRDCPLTDKMFVRIETVGSCCSLITDLFYERHGTVDSQTLGHLLRGTILGDSICLSPEADRVKPLDVAMVEKLEEEFNLDISDRHQVFNSISAAKQDVAALSTEQLLKKDMKSFTVSSTCVIMSSLHVSIQAFLKRQDMIGACSKILTANSASILIVLCSGSKGGTTIKHFIMYTREGPLRAALTELIDSDLDLNFTPTHDISLSENFVVRKFLNIEISRKQVLPKIKGFLQVITASDMMTKLRSDSDQLTFSLELSAPGTPSIMESPVPEFNSSHENSGNHTPNPIFYVEAPPNSYKDASLLDTLGPHLPSFNNSEMVKRIMIKKNKLTSDHTEDPSTGDVLSSEGNSGHNSCPFTPANSFVDRFAPIEHHLPSFNSREMVSRMLQKKLPLAGDTGDVSPADDVHGQHIFTPHNSECGGDLHSSPAFDQLDLEHRLSSFKLQQAQELSPHTEASTNHTS